MVRRAERTSRASQRRRLLIFAVGSLALHAASLGLPVAAGPGAIASAPPLTSALHATLVAPGASPALDAAVPVPQQDISRDAAAQHDAQEPHTQRARDSDAGALPGPDKWYTASELDVRAEPVTPVEFTYPPQLGTIIGRVEVMLRIDERGYVRKAEVLSAEPEKLFDEAALSGWRNVRFSPAMRSGVPVKSEKIVQIDFQPELLR